jgi:hypothetical protein
MSPRLLAVLAATVLSTHAASAQVKCGGDLPPIDRDAESRMTAQEVVREVRPRRRRCQGLGELRLHVERAVQTLAGDSGGRRVSPRLDRRLRRQRAAREVARRVNTLKRIKFADRDLDALRDAFVLTPDRVSTGDIVYSGRQRIGEFNASLFDVCRAIDGRRARLRGPRWVRAREDAVMRLCGRSSSSPIAPMRFEVVRALVAEQYWFPV